MAGSTSWTTPRTWTAGETVTDTIMNTHVRDDLYYLYNLLTGGVSTQIDVAGVIRSIAASVPASGVGIEAGYSTAIAVAYVQGYDRTGAAYKGLRLDGSTAEINGQSNGLVKLGTDLLVAHRHPYGANRHIESGAVNTSSAADAAVSFTNTYASDIHVVASMHDSALDGNHRVEVNTVTGTGFNVSVKDGAGARQVAGVFWIADGQD